jgi:hypothetical protein
MSPYPPPIWPRKRAKKSTWFLETLVFSDETTVVLSRQPDGKFRATSKSWDEAKVFLPDQVIEVWAVDGRLRIARKEKQRDTGDLQ